MNIELSNPAISIWCPLSEEELAMVTELAEKGFSADKIAVVLRRQKRLFLRDWRTEGTPIFEAYRRGVYIADADVTAVLLENAKKGNLTAIQQMDKKREEQRIENIKQEIFNSQ